jgi:hypothetical protein
LIGLAEQEINFDRFLSIRQTLTYHAGYHGIGRRKVFIAACSPPRPPSRILASRLSSFSLPPTRQLPGTRTLSRITSAARCP